jgi:hypothetical protein
LRLLAIHVVKVKWYLSINLHPSPDPLLTPFLAIHVAKVKWYLSINSLKWYLCHKATSKSGRNSSTSIFMSMTVAGESPEPSVLEVSVRLDTTALLMLTPCNPRYCTHKQVTIGISKSDRVILIVIVVIRISIGPSVRVIHP